MNRKAAQGAAGKREGVRELSAVTLMILPSGPLFLCDTHISPEPFTEDIVESTLLAATEVRAFGLSPQVALLSRSNFGSHGSESSRRMADAVKILHERAPDLDVDGEMHAETALSEELRQQLFGESRLRGRANLLVFPSSDAGHIAYSLLKTLGDGVAVGPIMVGAASPAHVVTQSITVRGLVNMSALSVAEAQLGPKKPFSLRSASLDSHAG